MKKKTGGVYNDTVHMQTIKEKNEKDSTIIDNQGLYVHGTEKDSNGKATVDYFSRVDVNIKTAEDFVKNISNNGNVLHINNDITIDENALSILGSDVSELEVSSNITIEGQGNVIDLNKLASITLKGNDIVLKDLTVRNSTDIGVNIYNSRDILLDTVNIENSTRYGIFVNGSTVNLKDCSTKDNNSGIMITRSRTLRGDKDIDSRVEVIGSIKQEESNINVGVTNLEMLDGHFQKNEFIVPNGIYNKYENDMEEKVLSEYYLNLFGITGEERNKKYKEQTTDYMIIQTVINAKENTEVKNPDGTYVRLAGDGVTDDTENLKKLIEYAASHGREIYFPEGIYKITDDIDLSTINLPALSNFTLSGDKDGQRRDHIIYSKGYKNLNIYGNYFKGMENGAAGGLKIRNGENAYIGSNHFYDVPVLTYIYGDLTQEECILYNTTIYNNLFHQVTNFGGQGTGILYYQSFRDGDDLSFKVTNADGTTGTNTWNDAFGDVQNFVIYKNQFLSDDRDQITISGRAQQAYKNGKFIASGNTYVEKDITVGYNSGNLTLTESTEDYALSKVNDGYSKYKDVEIPLAPATVDYKYLNEEINKANSFYDKIVNENLIGILGGQYPEEAVNELKDLISETEELIKTNSLNQWETNSRLTLIQETLEKLKASVNDKGESPVVDEITNITIEVGNTFDPMDGIVITDDRDTIDDLKVNVDLGNFDNNTPGKYIIKYTVEDRDGNITVVEREVTVIGEDEANKDESNKDESNKDEIN